MSPASRPDEPEIVPELRDHIEQRMDQLKITPKLFVELTGLTAQALLNIRNGHRRRYQKGLKWAVCEALRWTPDSIDRILDGEPPIEIDDEGAEHVATPVQPSGGGESADPTDRVVAELRAEMAELRALIEARTGGAPAPQPAKPRAPRSAGTPRR